MNKRGPRSSSGMQAIALNHLKHGLSSVQIVLPSESAEEWEQFHHDVHTQLASEGAVEDALASRVAELLWRPRRVVRAEEQFVSVDQMYRSILVIDRDEESRARGLPTIAEGIAQNGDAPRPAVSAGRAVIQKEFGPYARAHMAHEASSCYEETLPVLLPNDRSLEKIMKYEVHLSRLLNHALHELEALQDRRRGNPAPLLRIDAT